jgi:uncharacterized protein YdaU (DUF1376 family)
MHYFKRNIGDYHKKAGRLSMLEHGAYTLLIDSCYDRERFPTKQDAIDWCWARTPEEVAAVEFVLAKFFEFDGDVYRQNRISEEIEAYHKNALTNKKIAQDREAKRKRAINGASTKREQSVDEAPPNQEPITNNQEPLTKDKPKPSTLTTDNLIRDFGVAEQVAKDYMAIRKAKRSPLTQTALNNLINEFKKSGLQAADGFALCAANGWAGFKSDWLNNGKVSKNSVEQSQEFWDRALDYNLQTDF